MKSQVLHTVWCYIISGEAAGEIWHWSLSGVKGLTKGNPALVSYAAAREPQLWDVGPMGGRVGGPMSCSRGSRAAAQETNPAGERFSPQLIFFSSETVTPIPAVEPKTDLPSLSSSVPVSTPATVAATTPATSSITALEESSPRHYQHASPKEQRQSLVSQVIYRAHSYVKQPTTHSINMSWLIV